MTKIGIALSGGAAKGIAHIGVLKALDEMGVKIDIITGTSMGALVGAFYAAGKLDELEKQIIEISLKDIVRLLNLSWSPKGFLSGSHVVKRMEKSLGDLKIENLEKKFCAIAVDITNKKMVELKSVSLSKAVRASIAIPGIFTPIELNKNILVDGGVLEPLPINSARKLGAEFLFSIPLFSSKFHSLDSEKKEFRPEDTSGKGYRSLFKILLSTFELGQERLTDLSLALHPSEIVLLPDVREIRAGDFHKGKRGIEIGYEATMKRKDEILNMINSFGS